jgi:hypothetical protein
MSLLMQLCLTTKALTVSARAVGAAIALNTRAKAAIPIYLNHRFCFIIYLIPVLLGCLFYSRLVRLKVEARRGVTLRFIWFFLCINCVKIGRQRLFCRCYVELGAD